MQLPARYSRLIALATASLLAIIACINACIKTETAKPTIANTPDDSCSAAEVPPLLKNASVSLHRADLVEGIRAFDLPFCSAVIISNTRIATAAHCVREAEEARSKGIYVVFGPLIKSDIVKDRDNRLRKVKRSKVHDKSDVAVLEIDPIPPVIAGSIPVAPIPLHGEDYQASPKIDVSNNVIFFAGYGPTNGTEVESTPHLRCAKWHLNSFVESESVGGKTYADQFRFGISTDLGISDSTATRIVIRTPHPQFPGSPHPKNPKLLISPTPCKLDSGGPVIGELKGKWGLIGLISSTQTYCDTTSSASAADIRKLHSFLNSEFPAWQ